MKNQYSKIKVIAGLFWMFCLIPLQATESSATNAFTGNDSTQLQQGVTVKGFIRDGATKSPVLGAKVQTKDQKFSAISNEDGSFSINIPKYINLLYISAPDYSVIEYPLRGKSNIEVSLYATVLPLRDQTALTVDAQLQSVLGSDVRVIKHSGAPAIGASMFIRGYNSLNAGAQPLIVIDGVIFDNQYDRATIHQGFILNPLSNISPEDVESIQVIKDGTATYGSKGGNGVLLINTKRGEDQVTKITVSSVFGVNEKPRSIPVMNANQFRVYISDMFKGAANGAEFISTLPFLNDNTAYYDYARYHNDNNWSNDIYSKGATQSYDVNVSGGDNVALYNLSMGYADSKSPLISNDFSRFKTRFNADVNLTDKFKFSFDLLYSQNDRNLRDDGFSELPAGLITSPSALALIKAPFLIPYEQSNGFITSDLSDADFLDIANPLSIINKAVGISEQNYLNISIRPKYSFTNSLQLCGLINYSQNTLYEKYFRPDAGVADLVLIDEEETLKSFVKGQNTKQISMSANIFLNWKKQLNFQTYDFTGGFRFYDDSYKGEFGSGYNTPTDLNPNLSKDLKFRQTTGYDDRWRSFSWYINGEYNLYSKYFLSGVVTADASSRFGKEADMMKFAGAHWGIFPSINAAWLVSSEDFMSNLSAINALKLRLGYGLTGNDNMPAASTTTYFSSIKFINEYTGKIITNIGNTKLKPETVEKTNVGIDLNMFDNRLSVSADVFHHVTRDLLTLKQFKYISGMDSYWVNDGKMQNNGFDLSVNAKVLVLKGFQWEIGGSIAHYKNKILELPESENINSIYGAEIKTVPGQPVGLFYGYKTLGVFATTQEATAAGLKIANSTGLGYLPFTAGDMHFADLNEDNIIDDRDKDIIGDPNPDFTGSFNTQITYKRLSVSALFTYSYGNDVYNYVRSQLEAGSSLYNQSSALLNRWVSEGQKTSIPKSSYGDVMANGRFSDRWIEDGSYLRFKTLTLAYDVPVNFVFLSGFTISASVNNLLTFTKYLGVDPEFSVSNSVLYQGIDAGLLPQGKSFFVGLKLNL